MGGLGNQLFQIFTLISYSKQNNIQFYFENKEIKNGHRKIHYWKTLLISLEQYLEHNILEHNILEHNILNSNSNTNINSNTKNIIIKENHFHYNELSNIFNKSIIN